MASEGIIRHVREPSERRGGPGGRAALLVLIALGVGATGFVIARGPTNAEPTPREASPMVALGAQLLDADMLEEPGTVTRFRLNAVPVSVTSGVSDASLEDVLGEAHARCVADAPLDPRALAEALLSPPARPEVPAPLMLGTKVVDGPHGFVTCLERFAEPPARGAMRYAYARRVPDGGVRFVVLWTDAPVGFAELATVDDAGDVAGEDVPGLPRPPGAQRRWSFARTDGSEQLVIYGTDRSAPELEAWAMDALPRAGWSDPRASGDAPRVLRARHGGRHAYLVLNDDSTLVVLASATSRH